MLLLLQGPVNRRQLCRAYPDPHSSRHDRVVTGFAEYVRRFETSAVFSGPSVYFHRRAIARRRLHADVAGLLADELFLEYVYAVLPAWGMHRMGNQAAKVCEFTEFAAFLRAAAPLIEELWPLNITQVDPGSVTAVGHEAWRVIAALKVSRSETQIVAGSKVLHHVLPDLIPPIDRQYTFRFFTGQKAVHAGDQQAFLDWS